MGLLEDIKREALEKDIVIDNGEGKEIECELNKLFYAQKNIEKETEFIRHVMTRGEETAERKGLHASSIIKSDDKFCYREQVLSLLYKQEQGNNISVGLKRIYEEGNAIHEKWQRLFIRGNLTEPLKCDRSRFDDTYELSYTPDIEAAICGKEYVVEIKSVNTWDFAKMKKGTLKCHASGKKQLMLYMYLTGIHDGIVLCDDKNGQQFKVYTYKLDIKQVQPYIARLERIQQLKHRLLSKGKLCKRCESCTNSDCKRAKECNMRLTCWKLPGGSIRLE